MTRRKKRHAVEPGHVARMRDWVFDHREQQHVGRDLGVPSEMLDYRLVGAVGIVLDIVSIDSHCVFEIFIDYCVCVRLERLHYTIAEPLAKLGRAPEPWIGSLARRRADHARDLFVVRWRLLEAALENDVEAGEQRGQIRSTDFHLILPRHGDDRGGHGDDLSSAYASGTG